MKNFWLSAKVNSSLTASMTLDNSYDDKVLLRMSTNSLFNKAQIPRNITVQIKNKDERGINIGSERKRRQAVFVHRNLRHKQVRLEA
jgi:hypothetical protein